MLPTTTPAAKRAMADEIRHVGIGQRLQMTTPVRHAQIRHPDDHHGPQMLIRHQREIGAHIGDRPAPRCRPGRDTRNRPSRTPRARAPHYPLATTRVAADSRDRKRPASPHSEFLGLDCRFSHPTTFRPRVAQKPASAFQAGPPRWWCEWSHRWRSRDKPASRFRRSALPAHHVHDSRNSFEKKAHRNSRLQRDGWRELPPCGVPARRTMTALARRPRSTPRTSSPPTPVHWSVHQLPGASRPIRTGQRLKCRQSAPGARPPAQPQFQIPFGRSQTTASRCAGSLPD